MYSPENEVKVHESGDWYVAVDSCVLSRLELHDLGLQKPSFKSSSSDLAARLPQLGLLSTAKTSFAVIWDLVTAVAIVLCNGTPFFGG